MYHCRKCWRVLTDLAVELFTLVLKNKRCKNDRFPLPCDWSVFQKVIDYKGCKTDVQFDICIHTGSHIFGHKVNNCVQRSQQDYQDKRQERSLYL